MHSEIRTVGSLALLYAFRMLGLFMVLPVLALYGDAYPGSTPFLLGLALGIYGLTQALFQIPLGLLSDLFGRKSIIFIGLIIFALGSLLAAFSQSVEGLIVGRALQGMGAIASTIMAMVADLTSEENRTKAMAAIGASIGLSFTLALILGPAVAALGGLTSIFILSSVLAFAGMLVLLFVVPSPKQCTRANRDAGAIPLLLKSTGFNISLIRLNWGIFVLHCILMASFVAIPVLLESHIGIARAEHWTVYLPILLAAFILMLPAMVYAEKRRQVKAVFILAILILSLSLFLLAFLKANIYTVLACVLIFFIAFNLLEAMLPSLVSKIAPAGAKGTAMGIYSTSQFLGAFVGGVLGGWIVQNYGVFTVFPVMGVLALSWLVVAVFMQRPKHLSSLCVPVSTAFNRVDNVLNVHGVEDALLVVEESLLYLKVDKSLLDNEALDKELGIVRA